MRFGDTPLFAPPEAPRPPTPARADRPGAGGAAVEAVSAAVRLTTLGRLGASDPAGEPISARRKDLVLLAYLARRAPRAGTRQELAALFWEGRDETRARHSLRQALVQLRSIAGEAVRSDDELVWLNAGVVEVDATQLERHSAAGNHREAVRVHGGVFLAGLEGSGGAKLRQWVLEERDKVETHFVRSLQALLRESLTYQRWAEAVVWADRWAGADPLSEEAHLHLAESLHLAGRTEAALAVHATFRVRLKAERGEVPSAAFSRLRDRLQRESLTRDSLAPSPDSRAVSAPAFVGRDDELLRLIDLWSAVRIGGAGALAVVLGAEGSGKTRLVEEFARRLADDPVTVMVGRATSDAATAPSPERWLPFATARSVFRGLVAAPGLAAASPADLAEAATVIPALHERFCELPVASSEEAHVHQAFARVLGEIAYQLPVIIAVDDVSEADPASQRLLEYLAAHLPTGLFLILTMREDRTTAFETAAAPHLWIRLAGLEVGEIEAMAASMLTLEDDALPAIAARIAAASEGNPGLAGELLREMVDSGYLVPGTWGRWRLSDQPTPLPESPEGIIRRRVERLDPVARELLCSLADDDAGNPGAVFDGKALATHSAREQAMRELVERRLVLSVARPTYGYAVAGSPVLRAVRELASSATTATEPSHPRGGAEAAGGDVSAGESGGSWGARRVMLVALIVVLLVALAYYSGA